MAAVMKSWTLFARTCCGDLVGRCAVRAACKGATVTNFPPGDTERPRRLNAGVTSQRDVSTATLVRSSGMGRARKHGSPMAHAEGKHEQQAPQS